MNISTLDATSFHEGGNASANTTAAINSDISSGTFGFNDTTGVNATGNIWARAKSDGRVILRAGFVRDGNYTLQVQAINTTTGTTDPTIQPRNATVTVLPVSATVTTNVTAAYSGQDVNVSGTVTAGTNVVIAIGNRAEKLVPVQSDKTYIYLWPSNRTRNAPAGSTNISVWVCPPTVSDATFAGCATDLTFGGDTGATGTDVGGGICANGTGTNGPFNTSCNASQKRPADASWTITLFDATPPAPAGGPAAIPASASVGEPVNFSANWTDNTALASYTFTWNGSGPYCNSVSTSAPANFSGTASAASFNVSVIPKPCAGKTIGFNFTAADSSGNSATSSTGAIQVKKYDLRIALNASSVEGEAGDNLTLNVTVTNTGNQPDQYGVACAAADLAGSAGLNATSCGAGSALTRVLQPGESDNLTLAVNSTRPGALLVPVNASSTGQAGLSRTAAATFLFRPAVQVAADATAQATRNDSADARFNATFNLTLRNAGTRTHSFVLGNSSSAPLGLNVSFNSTSVNGLAPGDAAHRSVLVNSSLPPATYTFTVFVNDSADPLKNASLALKVVVSDHDVFNVSVSLDANSRTAEINNETLYAVTVKNAGNQPDSYDISLANTSERAVLAGLNTTTLANLAPGELRTGTLTVNSSAPGVYADKIAVRSTANGSINVTAAVTTVTRGVLLSAAPLAQTVGLGDYANYTVTVKNTGAKDHTYIVTNVSTVADPANNVSHPTSLTVAQGASRTFTLSVRSSAAGAFFTNVTAAIPNEAGKSSSAVVSTLFTPSKVCGVRLAVAEPDDDRDDRQEDESVEKSANGTYLLSVQNLGNVPDVVGLSVTWNPRGATVHLAGVPAPVGTTLNRSVAASSADTVVLQVQGDFGAYPVRVEARSLECNTDLRDGVRTVTLIKERTNANVENSFIAEDAGLHNVTITNASVGSLVIGSTVSDSVISNAVVNNSTGPSTITGSVLRGVTVDSATVANNIISSGTIAIGNLTWAFGAANATNINAIVNGADTNRSLGGASGDAVRFIGTGARANVNLTLDRDVPAASGSIVRTPFKPVGVTAPPGDRQAGEFVEIDLDAALRGAVSSGNPAKVRIFFDALPAGVDAATLAIRRHTGTGWQDLTGCTRQTAAAPFYVECDTPGFSLFAITGSLQRGGGNGGPGPQGGAGGGGGGAAPPAEPPPSPEPRPEEPAPAPAARPLSPFVPPEETPAPEPRILPPKVPRVPGVPAPVSDVIVLSMVGMLGLIVVLSVIARSAGGKGGKRR